MTDSLLPSLHDLFDEFNQDLETLVDEVGGYEQKKLIKLAYFSGMGDAHNRMIDILYQENPAIRDTLFEMFGDEIQAFHQAIADGKDDAPPRFIS